jgi:hypothetical protein
MKETDKTSSIEKSFNATKRILIITLIGLIVGLILGKFLGVYYDDYLYLEIKNFFGFLALALLIYSLNSYAIKTKIKASEKYKYYLLISKINIVISISLLVLSRFSDLIVDGILWDYYYFRLYDDFEIYLTVILLLSFVLIFLSFDLLTIRTNNNDDDN